MTWAIDQPRPRHGIRRPSAVMTDTGVRAAARPIGASGVGVLTALAAAWGGISAFVGPEFGYQPTARQSWLWSTPNWLLHLVPGAVGLFAGLLILGLSPASGAGRRSGLTFAALLAMASGAWFVIGPAVWPLFESSSPYMSGVSDSTGFVNQSGANLGPGLVLALLAGMALKAGISVPRVSLVQEEAAVPPAGTARRDGPTASVVAPEASPDPATAAAEPSTVPASRWTPTSTSRSSAGEGTAPQDSTVTTESADAGGQT
jgi:hypothetical protein